MSTLNATDIVGELKKANAQALQAVHELYYASLCHFAEGLLGDEPAARCDLDLHTVASRLARLDRRDFEGLRARQPNRSGGQQNSPQLFANHNSSFH